MEAAEVRNHLPLNEEDMMAVIGKLHQLHQVLVQPTSPATWTAGRAGFVSDGLSLRLLL